MIYVYYAYIPDKARDYTADGFPPAFPDAWREYVRSIKDDNRRRQSFFVRVLLLYALKKSGIKAAAFSEKDGRWNISSPLSPVDFSLSHSGNTVVAAINPNGKTGVDAERVSDKIFGAERFLIKDGETAEKPDAETLTLLWTERESRYKLRASGETFYKSEKISGADGEYIVTVAAEDESAANGAEFVRIKDLEKCIPYI